MKILRLLGDNTNPFATTPPPSDQANLVNLFQTQLSAIAQQAGGKASMAPADLVSDAQNAWSSVLSGLQPYFNAPSDATSQSVTGPLMAIAADSKAITDNVSGDGADQIKQPAQYLYSDVLNLLQEVDKGALGQPVSSDNVNAAFTAIQNDVSGIAAGLQNYQAVQTSVAQAAQAANAAGQAQAASQAAAAQAAQAAQAQQNAQSSPATTSSSPVSATTSSSAGASIPPATSTSTPATASLTPSSPSTSPTITTSTPTAKASASIAVSPTIAILIVGAAVGGTALLTRALVKRR